MVWGCKKRLNKIVKGIISTIQVHSNELDISASSSCNNVKQKYASGAKLWKRIFLWLIPCDKKSGH